MLFNKKRVLQKYMDFRVVYYWQPRHNWMDFTEIGLYNKNIEDVIEIVRAAMEDIKEYKLAVIYKKQDRNGFYELHDDNRLLALYKRDISFGLVEYDPDEFDTTRKVERGTSFVVQKNYLAIFRTSGHKEVHEDGKGYEMYAETLEECVSLAKQKLWKEFFLRYSFIYVAEADKYRGRLIKIIGKVNDTYELDIFEFKQYRDCIESKEFSIALEIYERDHRTPRITNENIPIQIIRSAERYSQELYRDKGDIKEIAECDKEGFMAVSISSTRYCMGKDAVKRLYIRPGLLEELKTCLNKQSLNNKSVVYWHDHENVVYRIFSVSY